MYLPTLRRPVRPERILQMPKIRWVLAVACLRIACLCQGVVGGGVSVTADGGPAPQVDAGVGIADAGADAGRDGGDAGAGGTSGDAGRGIPVGMPTPGCIDAGDPTLTVTERRLLAMPEDSWLEVPNSHLYETCKSASMYGDGVYLVQGCAGLINSWSSGLYDAERQRMVVWGGGHNDYGGNEMYAFNLKTFAWEQLTKPSRPPFDRDPLDDGNPVSR